MRRELKTRIDECVRLLKILFFFVNSFSLASLLSNSHYTRNHCHMQCSWLSTQRRCPWQNLAEQNENNIFFFALVYRMVEKPIFRRAKNVYVRVPNLYRVYNLNWLNGLCVTVVRLLAATTNSYIFSIHVFSIRSIIFDFISCLFVCAAQKKQLKNREKKTKWNENRLKLTHRRADLVLHMQFTSVNSYTSMSFSCSEIFSTECRSAKLTLCHCACVGRLFGSSFVQHFTFFFRFSFRSQ